MLETDYFAAFIDGVEGLLTSCKSYQRSRIYHPSRHGEKDIELEQRRSAPSSSLMCSLVVGAMACER